MKKYHWKLKIDGDCFLYDEYLMRFNIITMQLKGGDFWNFSPRRSPMLDDFRNWEILEHTERPQMIVGAHHDDIRNAFVSKSLAMRYQPHNCVPYHYAQPEANKIAIRPQAIDQFYKDAGEVIVERL